MNIKETWHKIKGIPIIGVPYQKFIGNKKIKKIYEQQSANIKLYGVDAIEKLEKILSEQAELYFVDCGTLLGVIRDHKFIEWDPDIDYGIVFKQGSTWENLQEAMEKNGYRKLHEWRINNKITEQTYVLEHITVDIFEHFNAGNGMSFYCYTRLPSKKYEENKYSVYEIITAKISNLRQEKLENLYVHVPDNAEEYIAYIYNDDWRTPNPNWVSFSGKGCSFRKDLKGEITRFLD